MNTEYRSEKEKLSALVDDELPPSMVSKLLNDLKTDPELLGQWNRYNKIGQALRGESVKDDNLDLVWRVSEALEKEPVILAPRNISPVRKFIKPLAGFAVAASVAAVTFLSIQVENDNAGNSSNDAPVVAMTSINQPEASSVITTVTTSSGTRWDIQPDVQHAAEVQDSLNNYLVNYNEHAIIRGRHGMLPYARIAGYDVE